MVVCMHIVMALYFVRNEWIRESQVLLSVRDSNLNPSKFMPVCIRLLYGIYFRHNVHDALACPGN